MKPDRSTHTHEDTKVRRGVLDSPFFPSIRPAGCVCVSTTAIFRSQLGYKEKKAECCTCVQASVGLF
jgi:hypothetical protein